MQRLAGLLPPPSPPPPFWFLSPGARKNFPIIIVDQSGRACDAMAAYIKHKEDNK